jgi:hypothetical protein
MNAEQMCSTLVAFADFVGVGRRAEALDGLAKLFDGLGPAKVAKIIATIEGNWKSVDRAPRYPAELRTLLEGLRRGFIRSGANTQAKALAVLLRLCVGSDNQSFDAFFSEAVAARAKKSVAKKQFTSEQAKMLADQLMSVAEDRKRFDALLDQLKGQFKVAELKTIAGLYTGYETTETKKDRIVKAIRHWHRQDELNRDRRASQAKASL